MLAFNIASSNRRHYGANIGTTITAFIIGINIGLYFYPLLAIGAACLFFLKKATYQHIGQILFGFGGLF